MLESKLVRDLIKWLNTQPKTLCWKMHGNSYVEAGIPDIIGVSNGYFFAIECKVGSNKTTAIQDAQINRIINANGLAFVVTDGNVEIFKKRFLTYFTKI